MRLTVEVLDALLQDGRAVVAPSVEEQAAITHLEAEGFIRQTREPVFRCFDPADDACADHPTWACLAWVPARLDEDRVFCPACGVDHEDRSPATSRLHLHVDAGRVVEWIDQRLRQIDPDARRRREGVAWSLATAELDAVVVWLDGSLDARLVTRAFPSSQPVVFVTTRSRAWRGRFRDEGWLAPLGLADWLLGAPTPGVDLDHPRHGTEARGEVALEDPGELAEAVPVRGQGELVDLPQTGCWRRDLGTASTGGDGLARLRDALGDDLPRSPQVGAVDEVDGDGAHTWSAGAAQGGEPRRARQGALKRDRHQLLDLLGSHSGAGREHLDLGVGEVGEGVEP